jgi:diguanylate cyclase (GGDEF)-like protein
MTREKVANIMVVDDNPNNLELLSGILSAQNYKIRRAINATLALRAIQASPPDLILLDINLPDMMGYDLCAILKQDPTTRDVPVIFVSALQDAADKVKGFTVGGVDYISKPFEMSEVLARVSTQLATQAAKSQIQHLNIELEQRVQERTAQLEQANQSLEQEIAERQRIHETLLHVLRHDSLTNLPNLAYILDTLNAATLQMEQDPEQQFALLALNCDRFHQINSSLGHELGDRLLLELGDRLNGCLPENAILARPGGAQFLIFVEVVKNEAVVEQLAQTLQRALQVPFQLEEHTIFISASIGIVMGTPRYERPEYLVRDAGIAMYQAKSTDARYQIFSETMYQKARERMYLENELRRALKEQEFVLYYQPIVSLQTGEISGFEALIRWQHPDRGMISPMTFIPIAEDTGLIIPLGFWVFKQACEQAMIWQQELQLPTLPFMSINVSTKQFMHPEFIAQIDKIIQETGMCTSQIKLEITESAIMENAQVASDLLNQLKERNIQLAIDDFGTGYSSLSYLHQFPVDTLKIDRSFISRLEVQNTSQHLPQNQQRYSRIVQSIITLAHDLGMNVVAEGVEVESQCQRLQSLQCEFGQGYLWAKPLESNAAQQLLQQNTERLQGQLV